MYKKLKEICEFIQANDKNSGIMDCYQEFEDRVIDHNTLIEECQERLDEGREDLKKYPEFPKYAKWLGI